MSLLEDVFLEDEAGEAQELERIIDGDEYDELNRATSPNSDQHSEKEDEAEEDKRRVDPTQSKTKRVVKNPRFVLNPARLTGPRGIQVIPEHFKDFKFKGKGHEKEDLDLILKKLEHWAYRLYPKFEFEDCLKKIETLGRKRPVMVHLHKIRNDQLVTDEAIVQKDSSDEEDNQPVEDEFDKLLQQQIELAQATPRPSSAKKPAYSTPLNDPIPSLMPKATSSPSISNEQRERMLRNRILAEERRLAKLKRDNTFNESLKGNTSSKLDVVTEGPSVNNSYNEDAEIHAENNTLKEIQNDSFTIKESDAGDNLGMNSKDKSKDANTEINYSDNEAVETNPNDNTPIDIQNDSPIIEKCDTSLETKSKDISRDVNIGINNSDNKAGETTVENDTPRDIGNNSPIIEECDTRNSLGRNPKDKSKDIDVHDMEINNSDGAIDNKCIKKLNNDANLSKLNDKYTKEGSEINDGTDENIHSNMEDQSKEPVNEEVMDIDFTEDF